MAEKEAQTLSDILTKVNEMSLRVKKIDPTAEQVSSISLDLGMLSQEMESSANEFKQQSDRIQSEVARLHRELKLTKSELQQLEADGKRCKVILYNLIQLEEIGHFLVI
ncbi:hypothetical protein QYM36_012264 [Artemia franciscana]|uniref:Uncharacterized protein n=1 Tax=Artemia franciscana TaxID=6661 RepID=A0AA88HIP6_ARTSF|nr:hypothetical protein QYM36_012264 [Artemia franciscana]